MSSVRSINIDFLKGIAILSVILFHANERIMPFGYLGVDIFLVIGGYFMMRTFLKDVDRGGFSYLSYLWNRIVRICPLVFILSAIAFLIGYVVMLPDDLENLAESIIASNLFSNNILACITTKDYWDVVNEYKPLMHTWYLGVLVQGYIVFPLLLMLCSSKAKDKVKASFWTVVGLTCCSLVLYLFPNFSTAAKFYYLPFRAFELLFGCIIAYYLYKHKSEIHLSNRSFYSIYYFIWGLTLLLLAIPAEIGPRSIRLIIVVVLTGLLLFLFSDARAAFRKNPVIDFIAFLGMASFSIYLWHQLELAIGRYCLFENWNIISISLFIIVLAVLSVFSYFLIEKKTSYFLEKRRRTTIAILLFATLFLFSTFSSLFVYFSGGIVRDVPELGVYKAHYSLNNISDIIHNKGRGVHAKYNSRVYAWDKDFSADQGRIKVLIVGDSFARDWANILSESQYNEVFDISYIYPYSLEYVSERYHRFQEADYIFCRGAPEKHYFPEHYNKEKTFIIGTKSFGKSNGFVYSKRFRSDYYEQHVFPDPSVMNTYMEEKNEYKNHYIDFVSCVIDSNGKVPAFTPEHKMISQDCRHLTKFGAKYYASIIDIKPFTTK